MTSMIGRRIREFEIHSEIGAGGYGAVYLARDTSVDRDVAVKVILPQHANQPQFVAGFEAEARLVAQLEHPHIVPLYSYWRDEDGAFLVMRYIRGGSLRSMLTQQEALPLARTVHIIEQIAQALNAAHEAGVVHRDLKPDNVLIDQRGNAYLTDFGIAKRLGVGSSTKNDMIKGTLNYMSPEQIRSGDITPQTDLYALGIMLYEMLAGEHPYHDTPVGLLVMKHLTEPLPPLSAIRHDLPAALDEIIAYATEKDPAARYETALSLAEALRALITSSLPVPAVPAAPAAPAQHPTTQAGRNRQAMLQNVRSFWVEGVLENSLHDAAMIELGLKAQSSAVDRPWQTLVRTEAGDEVLTDERIASVFERLNGKLLILGDPGSGKTTTLLNLARDLLRQAERDAQSAIPVVLNLSSWGEKQLPLTEWLMEELNAKYQVPRRVATQWVEGDELLLLLDGLDEVAADVREACVAAINAYRGEHGFVDVVVCSRIVDYEALSNQLKLNGAIVIQPLSAAQVVTYLARLGPDVKVVEELIQRDAQLRELSQSPLMLSVMILAFRGKTSQDIPDFDDVERQRQHLFEVYVERAFERRLGERPYQPDETQHYLTWLAGQMQKHNFSVFQIESLQPSWLPTEGQQSAFSVQMRRFASLYNAFWWTLANVAYAFAVGFSGLDALLQILTGTLSGGIWGYYMTHERIVYSQGRTKLGLLLLLACAPFLIVLSVFLLRETGPLRLGDVAVLGVIYLSLLAYVRGQVMTFANLKLRSNRVVFLDNIRFQFKMSFVSLLGVTAGGLASAFLYYMLNYIYFDTLASITFVNIAIEVVLAVLLSLLVFNVPLNYHNAGVTLRSQPNQGFDMTRRTMLKFVRDAALGFFITAPIMFVLGVALPSALLFGLALVMHSALGDVALRQGGFVLMQHLWLRTQLVRANALPRHLAAFLTYAADLILLRKVGGGYIFVHRYLLEYFADLAEAPNRP